MSIPNYKVLFIGPYGFSGSTLLDFALAQSPQVVTTGEMFQLAEWVRNNNLCTCRQPIQDCGFWTRALTDFGGGTKVALPPEAERPDGAGGAEDYRSGPLPPTDAIQNNARIYWAIFDRIAAETGARYVVDSSKHLWRLRLLATERPRQIHLLHLHRNPAVVARSAAQKKARPATRDGVLTPAVPTAKTLIKWVLTNRATRRFAETTGLPRLPVSYETLAERPEEILGGICDWLGIDYLPAMLMPATAGHHNVAGSRWRMTKDQVTIRPSQDVAELSASVRAMASLCTALGRV